MLFQNKPWPASKSRCELSSVLAVPLQPISDNKEAEKFHYGELVESLASCISLHGQQKNDRPQVPVDGTFGRLKPYCKQSALPLCTERPNLLLEEVLIAHKDAFFPPLPKIYLLL